MRYNAVISLFRHTRLSFVIKCEARKQYLELYSENAPLTSPEVADLRKEISVVC